jgi:hypothetical protein
MICYFQPSWTLTKSTSVFLTQNHRAQSDIDKMNLKLTDAKRFNDATITEANGMKSKDVLVFVNVNTTIDELPRATRNEDLSKHRQSSTGHRKLILESM